MHRSSLSFIRVSAEGLKTAGRITDKTPMSLLNKTPMSHQVDTVKKTLKYLGKESLEWEEFSAKYRKNINQKSVLKLAQDWDVSPDSLYALGIGFDNQKQAYTFAMRNFQGQIVGVRRRFYKDSHSKRCVKGSKLGLFIPDGVSWSNVQMVCEGESDAAAALTLHFAAIGRPGAMHCQQEAVSFLNRKLNACPCIVADNDKAGRDGASLLAADLLEAGVPCRLLVVPEPHADLRDWLKAGLTTNKLVEAIEAQKVDYPPGHPPGFSQSPHAIIRRGLIAKIRRTDFAVLQCLGSFADENGQCWPGRDKVAELTGLSIRQVDRAKNRLAEARLIVWRRGGTARTNAYHIDLGPCKGAKKPHKVVPALEALERSKKECKKSLLGT